jgi:hypothetical protein
MNSAQPDDAQCKPLDPEVYRRVRARAEKITAELRQKYGDMNLSADLIREVRDEK